MKVLYLLALVVALLVATAMGKPAGKYYLFMLESMTNVGVMLC